MITAFDHGEEMKVDDIKPRPRDILGIALHAILLFAFLVLASIASDAISTKATGTRERIELLEHTARNFGQRLYDLERRVLAIERPDRAVFPPGHHGRIGTATGTESSLHPVTPRHYPNSVSPRPAAGRGAGGEGPSTQPAAPTLADPNAIRDQ